MRAGRLVAAGSLLALAAILTFWVRSYFPCDSVTHRGEHGREWALETYRGNLDFWRSPVPPGRAPGWAGTLWLMPPEPLLAWDDLLNVKPPAFVGWRFMGAASLRGYLPYGVERLIRVPFWFLAVLSASAAPTWVAPKLLRLRERRRIQTGRCRRCGYDLRASAERCPECGTPITVAAAVRRGRRRLTGLLLAGASFFSLLLCVATGIMWVRSYRVTDRFPFVRQGDNANVTAYTASDRGGVWFSIDGDDWPSPGEIAAGGFGEPKYERRVLGFAWGAGRERRYVLTKENFYLTSRFCRWWRVPYWFPAVLTGMPPAAFAAWAVRRSRADRRRGASLCLVCGYDLRASSDPCLECGTPIRLKERTTA